MKDISGPGKAFRPSESDDKEDIIMDTIRTEIEKLTPGMVVNGDYLVKSCQIRTSNQGKKYATIFIGDKTGEIQGMFWEMNKPGMEAKIQKIQAGDVIHVSGLVNEYNGARQLKITDVSHADNTDLSDLVPSSPVDGSELFKVIRSKAEEINDDELRTLTLTLMDEHREKLEYFPAASKNHHAIRGGLLYHVYRMLLSAEALCGIYPVIRKDYIYTGVILHDIAKLFEIDANEMGVAGGYTAEGELLGHIIQGIKLVGTTCERLGITYEKKIAVEHMILSHHYEPEYGSPKKPMFPEAELLHHLDLLDARMYDMEKGLRGVKAGEFSDKIWTLDNRRLFQLP